MGKSLRIKKKNLRELELLFPAEFETVPRAPTASTKE